MDDDPQQTYSAREIVLELFPATHERLVPDSETYFQAQGPNGQRLVVSGDREVLLRLTPLSPAGKSGTQLCCDFCQRSAPRAYMQLFRVEVPGTDGRRCLYLSLCREAAACDERRIGNHAVRALLERLAS